MNRTDYTILMALAVLAGCAVESPAKAPPYIGDRELAESPIIVVARWDKADFLSHHRYRADEGVGRVITKIEAFTTLEVLRSIKGDVKVGRHRLMVGGGIGWSQDGTYVSSATSTEIPGDVSDVTSTNIWFLTKQRSWDEKDKEEYLCIDNHREIQPLILEAYFEALRSKNPDRAVPQLLKSDNPEVIHRALRYVCGDQWPWPYDSEFTERYLSPGKRGNPLPDEADRVAGVMTRAQLQDLRPMAAAVYAQLKGKTGGAVLAGLLADTDANVRGMAVALLVRQQDASAIDALMGAVNGITNGWMACKIIEAIQTWGDSRLAPMLIGFLQNGDSAGFSGDDLLIPAIKARQALEAMTGHVFPYDVAASSAAWKKVEGIKDVDERKRLLSSLLPCSSHPLTVEVVGSTRKAFLRVRNVSEVNVTVARRPSYGHQSCPGASYGCGLGDEAQVRGKEDFVTLQPGDNQQFSVDLKDGFLLADPASRKMTVVYDNNGSQFGVNAWIGTITVSFGSGWAEERKTETIEETWPNGNLKATGETVNGQRFGEWNFFNEQGDRTEIIYYASNRGSAKCNPEHPSNKGAGRR